MDADMILAGLLLKQMSYAFKEWKGEKSPDCIVMSGEDRWLLARAYGNIDRSCLETINFYGKDVNVIEGNVGNDNFYFCTTA